MNILLTFTSITFCIMASVYNGFLLEDRTQPPTQAAVVLSDNHFNMLLSLLVEERQARLSLENEVQQLRNDLLVTQHGVTGNYNTCQKQNETLILQSTSLQNLEKKYTALQIQYDSLKLEFNELNTNYYILHNHTIQLNQEVAALKQLNSVNDLKAIIALKNQSQHLEKELQATNTMLNAVANDVSARNQDFIALYNKVDATEQKRQLSVEKLEASLNNTLRQLDMNKNTTDDLLLKSENNQISFMLQLNTSFQTQLNTIKSNQNITMANLKTELYHLYLKMSDRVAVTACASTPITYQADNIILFPSISTRKGISSNVVTSLGNTGKFVCERPGLYLITSFILTDKDSSYVFLWKNNEQIAANYFSMQHWYQTHTVSVLVQLNVNDAVYIKTGSLMFIDGNPYSCMTILQISD